MHLFRSWLVVCLEEKIGGDGDGNVVLIVRVGGRQYSSLADIN